MKITFSSVHLNNIIEHPSGEFYSRISASNKAGNCSPRLQNYSDLRAGSKGERIAAAVATRDAVRPVTSTASKSKTSEPADRCPPRAKKAGEMARSADNAPVTSPQNNRSVFSATTVTAKCVEL